MYVWLHKCFVHFVTSLALIFVRFCTEIPARNSDDVTNSTFRDGIRARRRHIDQLGVVTVLL